MLSMATKARQKVRGCCGRGVDRGEVDVCVLMAWELECLGVLGMVSRTCVSGANIAFGKIRDFVLRTRREP